MVVVEPILLKTGEVLMFQSPHVPPFYLLTAKALRDKAEPKRVRTLTKTVRLEDGTLRPANPAVAFDALEGLAISVISLGGGHRSTRERRDPAATGGCRCRGGTEDMKVVYERDSMERGLNLEEKLALAAPLLTGRKSIKGTTAWEAYRRVIPLRNELLHIKPVAENNPGDPGPFGLLMLGKGSRAPEDAAAVIHAIEPDWIPKGIRGDLGVT